jgi:hypothetical protein
MKKQLLFGLLAICGTQMFAAGQLLAMGGEDFATLSFNAYTALESKDESKAFDAAMALLGMNTSASLSSAAYYFDKLGRKAEVMTCVDALINLAQETSDIENTVNAYSNAGAILKALESNPKKLSGIVRALENISAENPSLAFWINNIKSGIVKK